VRAGFDINFIRVNSRQKFLCVFAASAFIAFRRDKSHDILRVQKLGKNIGGYHGETIDIRAVLREVKAAAPSHGWTYELFYKTGDLDLFALHRPALSTKNSSASASSSGATAPKQSEGGQPSTRLYISTGIHGDEPAGPLAALKLLQENNWVENAEIFLLPCLNPVGFTLNKRENADGVDLNRDYRDPKAAETLAHIAWLERQPKFDLYLCLHEDWESHGFYLYEQNPDNKISLAEKMIEAVKTICPIDPSEIIEDRPAQDGIIRPNISPQERPLWPEALYLISHKARQGYTLEAPSDFPLATRVDALVAAVNAAVAK
jgi:succinylglutamate desuccinylase/aspartoacylase family protein